MEVDTGALRGKPGNHQNRSSHVMYKRSEGVTSNALRKCNENKMLASRNAMFVRDSP